MEYRYGHNPEKGYLCMVPKRCSLPEGHVDVTKERYNELKVDWLEKEYWDLSKRLTTIQQIVRHPSPSEEAGVALHSVSHEMAWLSHKVTQRIEAAKASAQRALELNERSAAMSWGTVVAELMDVLRDIHKYTRPSEGS